VPGAAKDEREPLLRLERQRREAHLRERLAARHRRAVEVRGPLADEHEREVGERGEVAGRAHRALAGDVGDHPPVQHRHEQVDDLRPRARAAHGDRLRAERDHASHGVVGQQRADAARVAADEVVLERPDLVGADARLREGAEARVHAVHIGRLVPRVRQAVDDRAGGGHALAGAVREDELRLTAREGDQLVERPRLTQGHFGANGSHADDHASEGDGVPPSARLRGLGPRRG